VLLQPLCEQTGGLEGVEGEVSVYLLATVGIIYLVVGIQGISKGDVLGFAFVGYAIAQVAFVVREFIK
jgi:hypothetical protein